jgi:hypothetical protein
MRKITIENNENSHTDDHVGSIPVSPSSLVPFSFEHEAETFIEYIRQVIN